MDGAAPILAIAMPVRNAAPFLDASVGSILRQTHRDFEFVALDDASTDRSAEVLDRWARRDTRLRVERSDRHLGPVESSNRVVRATTAPFIARMDADDVSHEDRLSRQMALLTADPKTVLVGTLFEGIDDSGRIVRPRDRWRLLRPSPFSPFPHGSAVFRRDAFEAVGGYTAAAEYWEDLDLFRRLSTRGRVLVLPDALYRYRFHASSVRLAGGPGEVEAAVARMLRTVHTNLHDDRTAHAHPLVAYSLAASRIWSAQPAGLLRSLRLQWLARPAPVTLGIATAALMNAMSPVAARTVLAAAVAARDRLAARHIGSDPVEWHFA